MQHGRQLLRTRDVPFRATIYSVHSILRANMLTTSNFDVFGGIEVGLEAGVTAWSAVTLALRIPYVFITCASKNGAERLTQSVVLWRPEDILRCCVDLKAKKSKKILDLALLLPVSSGKAYGWRWIPVKEVWGTVLTGDTLAYPVYVGFDGERISGFGELGSIDIAKPGKRVFISTRRS